MKKLIFLLLIAYAPFSNASTYICKFPNSDAVEIRLDYFPATLYVKAEGPTWIVEGHVVRHISKTSDRTMLSLPSGLFGTAHLDMTKEGKISSFYWSGNSYACRQTE